MSRHFILASVLALVATATTLLLADVGAFDEPGSWLFDRYQQESLWKKDASPAGFWLSPLAASLAALIVAWVAIDQATWTPKFAVLAAALGSVAFLSLTLAFYHVAFNPWPGLAATSLAFAMGCLLAETPAARRQREGLALLGSRLSHSTLHAWNGRDEPTPWATPGLRPCAVLAVRLIAPPPTPESAARHLEQLSRTLGLLAHKLHQRPGVVLDTPAGDSLRAFFGFLPETTDAGLEQAARTALECADFLQNQNATLTPAGQPALTWGLGLSLGTLLTGPHGQDPDRFWTASGPATEQARQLAALNAKHQTTILVGRRAAELLAPRFTLHPVEGDAIHSLLAPKPSPSTPDDLPTTALEDDLPNPNTEPTTEPTTEPPTTPPEPGQR